MSTTSRRIALVSAAALLAVGIVPLGQAATAPPAQAVDYSLPSLWEEYRDYFIMGTFGDWSNPQALYHYRTNSPSNPLKLDGQIGPDNTNSLSRQTYTAAVADIEADTALSAEEKAAAIEVANRNVVLQDTLGQGQSENILQAIQAYNQANNLPPDEAKVVRAHVLAWHGGQQPNYFFCNGFIYDAENPDWASEETMLARLDDYIRKMMNKYAPYNDIIYSWDVVNEPIDDYTGQIRNGDDYQPGQWGRIFRHPELDGDPDARLAAESAWVRQAFASARQWSNAAGADWKLYINDFQDSNKLYEPKMSQTIKMMKPIYEAGNVDGYGMQGRLSSGYPTIELLREQIELGLTVADEISISEGDIRSDFIPNPYYDPNLPTRRVVATDPQYETDETATGSVALIGNANGNTYDVFNSPVMRRRDWPTAGLDIWGIIGGDFSSIEDLLEAAASPQAQQEQADFAADWMDLLIEYKDKVIAYQWDGTNDLGTFNSSDGAHLWAGKFDWSMWGLPVFGDDVEKPSFFAVIGAPARDKLRQAIAAADALSSADFEGESWAAIQRAKTAAAKFVDVRIYDIDGVNKVKNATARLDDAMRFATTALEGLVGSMYMADLTSFTASSTSGLAGALAAAKDALEDPNGTAQVRAEALAALKAAVGRLVPRSPDHLNSSLGVLVSLSAGYEHARTTFAGVGYERFQKALADARALLQTDPAERSEARTQAVFDALRAAIAGLELIPQNPPAQTPPPTAPVPVPPPGAATPMVKVAQSALTLVKGKAVKVAGRAYTATGTAKVTWKSSNKKVATVSASGKITAKRAGKATITAKSGSLTAKLTVRVLAAKPAKSKVTSVSAKVPGSLAIGATASITGTYKPATATSVKVTYASSNPGVVTVDSTGLLVAKAAGTAKITVKAGGKSKAYTVKVA
ncbi:MAG: endo-1,4-beta-xylanase [Bifidobacteriaceae bacterium]|jgi:GH35 family endo-1,4-beta-xylanase|nr:endo-1,4-beta-xylanase [Bifidobacteriaceae bacterium]